MKSHIPGVNRLWGWALACSVLAASFPSLVSADASADSKGSDWWGDNSGWVWNWPGIARKPGGTVTGQYRHWFEGAEPAAWVGHGPAAWSLPAAASAFPYWPGTLTGDTGGMGAFSTDIHTDQATSDWQWEAYRNVLFPSEIVFRKGTKAYANAKDIESITTAAHSRTRLVDPWEFENPDPGSQWSLFGRIAPQGTLMVNEDQNEHAAAFFELNYAVSTGESEPIDILHLSVAVDGTGPNVTLVHAPEVHFYRDGIEILADQILTELTSFYVSPSMWELTTPPGEALNEGYYFDVAYNISPSISTAMLFSTPVSGADDLRFVVEPPTILLLSAGLFLLGAPLFFKPRPSRHIRAWRS